MKKNKKLYLILITVIAAFGGLLFGYDTGVISGALIQLKSDFELTNRLQEWIVSVVLLGASAGAIFSGRITDILGRKKVIIITAVLFGAGSIGLAMANSVFGLIFWRVFIGIAIGIASYAVPLFISEISPTGFRGALVSINQLAITVGILASYLVDLGFAEINEGWRWMFLVGLFPSLILGIGMIFLSDTPRWLFSNGKEEKAREVLEKVGETKIDETVQEIQNSLSQEKGTAWSELTAKWVRPAMFIGIGIMFFQQFTGINTIIYYSPTIFEMAGFGIGEAASPVAAVIKPAIPIGIISVVFTVIAMFLIDKWGRKPLLFLGLTGMVVALMVLGFSFTFYQSISAPSLKYLSIGSMLVYIPFFAISLGPIAWLLISEVFPTRIRGVGMSIATLVNWFSNFIISNTFLTLGRVTTGEMPNPAAEGTLVNPGGSFLIYAIVGILGIIFVNRYIPETKGHSLEKIEQHFLKGKHPKEL